MREGRAARRLGRGAFRSSGHDPGRGRAGRRAGGARAAAHRDLAAGGGAGAAERDRARRWPTPTGTSHGSTPGCCRARRRCGRRSTATSSTRTAAPDDASLYPGQNTTGLCPVTDFDGRPIWREGAEPTAEEIAARHRGVPRALPRGAGGRDRAGAGAARGGDPLRLPLDPQRDPVPVRGHAAGLQRRHRRRRELRAGGRGGVAARRAARAAGYTCVAERPVQGRLDHPPLRPPGARGATRCRWSWRRRPTWTRRRPGPGDPERAERLRATHLASILETLAAGRRRAEETTHDRRLAAAAATSATSIPPTGPEITRQELADRGADADADEQPAPGRRREPARAGGLRRHRAGGADLGGLRPDRRDAEGRSRPTRRCWCSRASRWACSAPTPTRRAC